MLPTSERPLFTRQRDGLRFEPCYHPGMARCEACLQLVEPTPAATDAHVCVDWWRVPTSEQFEVFRNDGPLSRRK